MSYHFIFNLMCIFLVANQVTQLFLFSLSFFVLLFMFLLPFPVKCLFARFAHVFGVACFLLMLRNSLHILGNNPSCGGFLLLVFLLFLFLMITF